VHGLLPALYAEWLGDRTFCEEHGTRFAYVTGAMATGIASADLVCAASRAGFLAFYGAGGLDLPQVERGIDAIARSLGDAPDAPWGANLIHSPDRSGLEDALVDLYLARGVARIEASAFMALSPAIVRFATTGLHCDAQGRLHRPHRVMAKISRPEVARHFLQPPPADMLARLVSARSISVDEARLAALLPIADDVTCEADSGGHTDRRPLSALLPVIRLLRDELAPAHGWPRPVRIGAAGGIADPTAVAAAFALGADYVVTGTVNQLARESGTSALAKEMLTGAGLADVTMAPAADMFELGVEVQVLRRGTLFAQRARRLYELYRTHDSVSARPRGGGARRTRSAPPPGAGVPLVSRQLDKVGARGRRRAAAGFPDLVRSRHRRVQRVDQGDSARARGRALGRIDRVESAGRRRPRHPRTAAPRGRRRAASGRAALRTTARGGIRMSSDPIAIVGLATLLPGSDDLAGYWRTLVEGADCLSDVPPQHWRIDDYYDSTPRAKDKTYGRRGGFVRPQPFDSLAFGLPPSSLPSTDVAQLLALLIAQRCIADADNGAEARFDRRRTSVILGGAVTTQLVAHMSGRMARPMWREGMRRAGLDEAAIERACDAIADQFVPWQESTFPGLLGNVIAGRIANRFDLGGTNCIIDAACASSLAAVSMAVGELRSGRADTVLTGGVDALNDVLMFLCFSQTPALSITGDCRPFSDQADGTMLGEGLGLLALRRLADAERDGHRIYALIRGLGTSSDGRARSVYAPHAGGQVLALRRAYDDAGYSPATVELMEGHGTGTVAGDAAEVAALTEVFGEAASASATRERWCALGSVKSQIGHTKAAAGAASLVKAVLALQHGTLPPTIKVERPSRALGLDGSPFYVNTTARPWFRRGDNPRRASVSSFGFGGSNFHIALEEYRGASAAPCLDVSPVQLLLLSADDADAGALELQALPDRAQNAAQLARLARDSRRMFRADAAIRVALFVGDASQVQPACDEAISILRAGAAHASTDRVAMRRGAVEPEAKIAFLFPGQGSQYLSMGRDLAVHFDAAFEAWEQAVRVLGRTSDEGLDLGDVVFPRAAFDPDTKKADADRLRATRWAQPALAAASLAQLALLDRLGVRPTAAAGHSFGELTALHAAGAFDADTLVRLAHARGRAIEASLRDDDGSVDAGGMLAVAGDAALIRRIVEAHDDPALSVANDNHPRQVVLSGSSAALHSIEPQLAEAGFSSRPLNVAAAFHSPLVAGAAAIFARDVEHCEMRPLAIPVVANATAQAYPRSVAAIGQQLHAQLAQPVRFRESVDALYGLGCRVFVEVGASDVLTGLVGNCLRDRPHAAIALDTPGRHGVESWWRGVGALAVLGVPMNFDALDSMNTVMSDTAPASPGPAVVHIGGANLGKPYPPAPGDSGSSNMSDRPQPPASVTLPAPESTGDVQAQILEAQRMTQQAILESFSMTLRGLGGAAVTPATLAAALPTAPSASSEPVPAAKADHASLPSLAPMPSAAAPPAPVHAALPPPSPVVASATAAAAPSAGDMTGVILAIIGEKTGYPVEVLTPEMELEADLGIDSIKRVEILSAVSQRVPGVQPTNASLLKIRRISDLLALAEDLSPDPR
jgi:PfaD family protein